VAAVIAYEVAVWCDAAGCEGSLVWDIVHTTTNAAVDSRAYARSLGWGRHRSGNGSMVDLCPEHNTGWRP
jgi:hypothetical protein